MMQIVMRALVSKMDFDSECSRDVRLGAREGGFVSACVCVSVYIYIYIPTYVVWSKYVLTC